MRVVSLLAVPREVDAGRGARDPQIGDLGIVGDRQWAIVDLGTGLGVDRPPCARAALCQGPARRGIRPDVEVELPDGTVTSEAAAVSAWLGRDVELPRRRRGRGPPRDRRRLRGRTRFAVVQWDGPDGTFHDSGLHPAVGARHRLDRRVGPPPLPRQRARRDDAVGEEEALVDHRVTLGSAVLDVTKPIDRCVMTVPATRRHRARPRRAPHDQRRAGDVPRRRHAGRAHPARWKVGDELRALNV